MLSLRDCLDLSDLSDGELIAIVRHENLPPIVALELGHRLLQSAGGRETLRQFILDDIMGAQRRHRCRDCEQFSRTLADYNKKHRERRKTTSGQDESLRELLAIGQAEQLRQVAKGSKEGRTIARKVQAAKDRHDCCACRRLSLRLIGLLESAGGTSVAANKT